METPCIDVCQINQTNGLCEGCWRSISEITDWARMTPGERRVIMAELPARADAANASHIRPSRTPQSTAPATDWEA